MLGRIDHGEVRELRLDRPPANALSLGRLIVLREAVEAALVQRLRKQGLPPFP